MNPEEERVYEDAVLARNYAMARKVSWNVENLRHSSKACRMLELIREAEEEGRKIIVFTFFLETAQKVRDLLGTKCMDPINGSVPPRRRQEIIDQFDKAPAGSVLGCQIQSGGTGLNIQTASVVIICEPQFKPSIENQAISRAYRMGQTRNVLVYRLLCVNSVDEKIMDMLEEKQAIFDAFADKSEAAAAHENLMLDDKNFGEIINEEIERIKKKRGDTDRSSPTV
jgi:SNF2 family DNA or RNA helicase